MSDGQRRAENHRDICHTHLGPNDHQGGFSSGGNIQTEIKHLLRKDILIDMTGNSGVMENNI